MGKGSFYQRVDCFRQGHFPLAKGKLRDKGGGRVVYQADYLTSAEIDWLKVVFLRKPESTIRLGVSLLGDVGLAQVAPFWACLFFSKIIQIYEDFLTK